MSETQKSFFPEILSLFEEFIFSFLKFWISVLTDFKSFRNKLVLISTILCVYVIYSSKSSEVIVATLAIWNIIIAYYFKKRNESAEFESNKGE